jgi:hypothetical protein
VCLLTSALVGGGKIVIIKKKKKTMMMLSTGTRTPNRRENVAPKMASNGKRHT